MWKFSSSTALSFEINCDSTTLNKHEIFRIKNLQQKQILNILLRQLFLRYFKSFVYSTRLARLNLVFHTEMVWLWKKYCKSKYNRIKIVYILFSFSRKKNHNNI